MTCWGRRQDDGLQTVRGCAEGWRLSAGSATPLLRLQPAEACLGSRFFYRLRQRRVQQQTGQAKGQHSPLTSCTGKPSMEGRPGLSRVLWACERCRKKKQVIIRARRASVGCCNVRCCLETGQPPLPLQSAVSVAAATLLKL